MPGVCSGASENGCSCGHRCDGPPCWGSPSSWGFPSFPGTLADVPVASGGSPSPFAAPTGNSRTPTGSRVALPSEQTQSRFLLSLGTSTPASPAQLVPAVTPGARPQAEPAVHAAPRPPPPPAPSSSLSQSPALLEPVRPPCSCPPWLSRLWPPPRRPWSSPLGSWPGLCPTPPQTLRAAPSCLQVPAEAASSPKAASAGHAVSPRAAVGPCAVACLLL